MIEIEKHAVYGDDDNWYWSDCVTRDFGENRRVVLSDGSVVFSVVQPANEHVRASLPVVGYIEAASGVVVEAKGATR